MSLEHPVVPEAEMFSKTNSDHVKSGSRLQGTLNG